MPNLDETRIADLVQRKCRYAAFVIRDAAFADWNVAPRYDLVAIERDGQWAPRIRVADVASEASDPGRKMLVRYVDESGAPVCDVAYATKERLAPPNDVRFVDRTTGLPTRLTAHTSAPLLTPVLRSGRRVHGTEAARTLRDRAARNVKALAERHRRLVGAEPFPSGTTVALAEIRAALLAQARGA